MSTFTKEKLAVVQYKREQDAKKAVNAPSKPFNLGTLQLYIAAEGESSIKNNNLNSELTNQTDFPEPIQDDYEQTAPTISKQDQHTNNGQSHSQQQYPNTHHHFQGYHYPHQMIHHGQQPFHHNHYHQQHQNNPNWEPKKNLPPKYAQQAAFENMHNNKGGNPYGHHLNKHDQNFDNSNDPNDDLTEGQQ